MKKNKYEFAFNKNISYIIMSKIEELNKYNEVVKDILCEDQLNERYRTFNKFKLTDSILIEEINKLFGSDCFTDRTFMNIKQGSISSSGFNIFIILYVLNDLIEQVNERYRSNGKEAVIDLIDLNSITDPLLNS